jgi:WD40 repeat protein
VRAVAFAPDGKRLVSGDRYGGVFVWSVPDGKPLGKLPMPGGSVFSIVPIGNKHVILSPVKEGAVLRALDPKDSADHRFAEHEGATCAAVSRDGKQLVTVGQDHLLIHWSLTTRKSRHRLRGHTAPVSSVAISPDGKFAVSGGADKELRLWDLVAGRAIRGLTGHTSTIWSVAVSPDGRFALSGSADGTMRLWSVGP